MYCAGLLIHHRAKIVQDISYTVILGYDFMVRNQVDIRVTLGCLTIFDDVVRLPLKKRFSDDQVCVISDRPVYIPPFTEAYIPVKCPLRYNNKSFLVDPIPITQFKDFTVARSMSHCINGIACCKVLNHNPKPIVLRKRTRVGIIENIESIVQRFHRIEDFQQMDDRLAVPAINRPGNGRQT